MREMISEVSKKHIDEFSKRMKNVERLNTLNEYIDQHPEIVTKAFFDYHHIFKSIFQDQAQEPNHLSIIETLREANKMLNNNRIDIFLSIVGNDQERFQKTLNKITTDNTNILYQSGIEELTEMMKLADSYRKEIDQRGEKPAPKDGTEPWDSMIWGYTNGADDPITDIHFIIAHGINRIFAQEYKKEIESSQLSKVEQKDWLVNVMTDLIILKQQGGNTRAQKLYEIWKPKRPNGLGWISDKREDIYKKLYSSQS